MHIRSREYKVIADSSLFVNAKHFLTDVLDDLGNLAHSLGLEFQGEFNDADPRERTIVFLDTPDFTLRRNSLLMRQRINRKNRSIEYTLKCRTEDRYIAEGSNLGLGLGLDAKPKFEEDVGCPFVSRFSRSITITLDDNDELISEKHPKVVSAAARLFPGLLDLGRDGMLCAPETELLPVNGRAVFERVFLGPKIGFPRSQHDYTPASVAVILWSKDKSSRPLTAEISFRYEDDNEDFAPEVAIVARRFFEGLQHLDWTRPDGTTKTQFMYGGA